MRSLRLAAVLLVISLTLGRSAEWRPEVLQLERLVLENPQDGAAFHDLRNIIAREGRLHEWADRWRVAAEHDAAAAAMAGWTDLHDRRPAQAIGWFEKSIALSPRLSSAWIGLARAQFDTKSPRANQSAREAAARAQTDEQLTKALWLLIHAAGEDSRELLIKETETLPPEKMWLLAAEAAQARRLFDTHEPWLAELEKCSLDWPAAAAAYAQACRGLGDAALAERVALEAMRRFPEDTTLPIVARIAAEEAGDGNAVTKLIEKHGPKNAAELPRDFARLVRAGSDRTAATWLRERAPELTRSASQWRGVMRELWRQDLTGLARESLARHAAGSWEGDVALAEAALLEGDIADAKARFRAVTRATGPMLGTALTDRANNQDDVGPLYLPGHKLQERLARAEPATWEDPPRSAEDGIDRPEWEVRTLIDARDLALIARRELARKEDAGVQLAAELRSDTAAWPAGERLLAAAIVRSPLLMIEALEAVRAGLPQDYETEEFSRLLLQRMQAIPWLAAEEAVRLQALASHWRERPAAPKPKSDIIRASPWSEYSLSAFNLFRQGKFDEAERHFHGALKAGQMADYSGEVWTMFFNSLIQACPGLDAREADGYATVLRWLAIHTVLRLDWPQQPDAAALLDQSDHLHLSYSLLYPVEDAGPRLEPISHFTFATVNGVLPDEQRAVLELLVFRLRRAGLFDHEARPWRGRVAIASLGLPPGIQRQLRLYEAITLAGGGLQRDALREFLSLSKLPLGETAALLAAKLLRERSQWEDDAKEKILLEPEEPLKRCEPQIAIGRAGFAAALYVLGSEADRPARRRRLEREMHSPRLLQLLRGASIPNSEKLRLTPAAVLIPAEPRAAEVPEALRHLLDIAEIDAAAKLARESLRRSARALAFWAPARNAAWAALKTLIECGELGSWVSDAEKRLRAGPDSQQAAEQLVFLADALQQGFLEPALEHRRKDGLMEKIFREAQLAAKRAREHLPPRQKDLIQKWQDRLNAPPVVLAAELRESLATSPDALPPASWLIRALPEHPELNAVLATCLRQRPLSAKETEEDRYSNLDSLLLIRGMEGAALDLQKQMLADRRLSNWKCVEATNDRARLLAARGDSEGCAEAVADFLARVATPAAIIGGVPAFDDSGAMEVQPAVAQIIERAWKARLLPRVRQMLDSRGLPFSAELAHLCETLETAGASRALRDRLAGATPVPTGLLIPLAQLCADLPAARDLACRALERLEPCRPLLDAETLTKCATAAARAGYPRAGEWIRAAARFTSDHAGSLRLRELVVAAEHTRDEALLAEVLEAFRRQVGDWYKTNVVTWLYELAAEGKHALFDRVRAVTESAGVDIITDSDGREVGAVQARAAFAGDASKLVPILWFETPPDQNGAARLRWDLGWWRKGRDSGAQFCSPGANWRNAAGNMNLELFGGESRDAMESIARIDARTPVFEAKLPAHGYVTTILRSGDRAQLGKATQIAPVPVRPPEIGSEFPLQGWHEETGGPTGHFLRPIWKSYSTNVNAAQKPCKVIKLDGANDVVVAAWLRGARVRIELISRDGKKLREARWFSERDPNWTWHELRIGHNGTAEIWGGAEEGGELRVYVDPMGDVGGLDAQKSPREKLTGER